MQLGTPKHTTTRTTDLNELMDKLWNGLVEPGDNHSTQERDHMRAMLAEAYALGFQRGKESAQRESDWDSGPMIGRGDW